MEKRAVVTNILTKRIMSTKQRFDRSRRQDYLTGPFIENQHQKKQKRPIEKEKLARMKRAGSVPLHFWLGMHAGAVSLYRGEWHTSRCVPARFYAL